MNRLKQNRAASFVVVTLVYIIATVVGVLAYRALTLDWRLSLAVLGGGGISIDKSCGMCYNEMAKESP